jgi:hypothetical protein
MALNVFEELRFISELIIAELLFVFPVAPKKSKFWLRIVIGAIICLGCSFGYFGVRALANFIGTSWSYSLLFIGWYTLLTIISFGYIWACFSLPLGQIIFRGIAAYAVQHIEYVFVNEALALALAPALRDILWLYAIVCIVTYAILCTIFYFSFVNKFRDLNEVYIGNKAWTAIIYVVLLIVTIYTTFMFQRFFRGGAQTSEFTPNYAATNCDFVFCGVLISLLYCLCSENMRKKEIAVVNRILYDNGKQYEMRKEAVELLNHKCHDLKHQIAAMKYMTVEEQQQSIEELQKLIMFYDGSPETHNEVLNTIFMEKELYCIEHNIKLNFVGDGFVLSFIDTVDLYSLFGNALDNAVECVSKLDDNDKKTIDCHVSVLGDTISIKMSNFAPENVTLHNGLPRTGKSDNTSHGFGLKSIKRIAEKYKGNILVTSANNIFTLTIFIPCSDMVN